MFNSLKYAKMLEDVGHSRAQAEAHVQMVTEIMETHLATKDDIHGVRGDIRELRGKMEHDFSLVYAKFDGLKSDLESRIVQSEYRMTIRLGTIISIALGAAVTLTKLIG
ncbi:MAG TPA: hypothetical protein VFV50_07910 [Bdellovibrionales bacterium]|nr:hypothetical protein [Bdellovibrionales bacterium]